MEHEYHEGPKEVQNFERWRRRNSRLPALAESEKASRQA